MATLTSADALELLRHGQLDIEGRLVDASNTTLRAVITLDDVTARCVYKPVRGERPLWDFPDGTLAGREVSAYLVGEATGWAPVPPTVLRDGPLGPGACQLWIETDVAEVADPPDGADSLDGAHTADSPGGEGTADSSGGEGSADSPSGEGVTNPAGRNGDRTPEPLLGFIPRRRVPRGWHRIASAQDEDGRPYVLAHANDARLARLAAFDIVINNADRKGGHVIQAGTHVYGVDHGVSFHIEPKLRTILWGFIGEPLAEDVTEVLRKLRADVDGTLGQALCEHLMTAEVAEVAARVERLLAAGCYPAPSGGWPAVPWPPI